MEAVIVIYVIGFFLSIGPAIDQYDPPRAALAVLVCWPVFFVRALVLGFIEAWNN